MNRRQLLGAAGAGVASALAGCGGLGGSANGNGGETATAQSDPARYAAWMPADVTGTVRAVTLQYDALADLQSTPTGSSTPTPTPTPETVTTPEGRSSDPLVAGTTRNLFAIALLASVAATDVPSLVEPSGGTDQITLTDASLVFEGSYDTETLASSPTDANNEETKSNGEFTYYTPSEGTTITAVGEETVVLLADSAVSDPEAAVDSVVTLATGEGTTYASEQPAFDTLSRRLTGNTLSAISYSGEAFFTTPATETEDSESFPLRATGLSGDAVGMATNMTLEEETYTARAAITYTSADAVDGEDAIADAVGYAADGQSVTIDGDTATVSGTYDRINL